MDGTTRIDFLDRSYLIYLDGIDFDEFWRAISLIDGTRSLQEISLQTGLEIESLSGLIFELDALGLATSEPLSSKSTTAPLSLFLTALNSATTLWKRHVFQASVFDAIDQSADRALLGSLLIQTYHYVGMCEEAISIAGKSHGDTSERFVSRHLSGENDHQRLILDSLEHVDDARVCEVMRRPLMSTIALGSFVQAQAARSFPAFLGLFKISEVRPIDKSASLEFLTRIEEKMQLKSGALNGLRAHVGTDVADSHYSVLDAFISEKNEISHDLASDIINSCHTFKHLLDAWYAEIFRFHRNSKDSHLQRHLSLEDFL